MHHHQVIVQLLLSTTPLYKCIRWLLPTVILNNAILFVGVRISRYARTSALLFTGLAQSQSGTNMIKIISSWTLSPAQLNKNTGMGYRTPVALIFHSLPFLYPLSFLFLV